MGLYGSILLALRSFARQPLFAVVGILTLAVGIGANSAIFSVVNALLLKPLPFQESNRLMQLYMVTPPWPEVGSIDDMVWSYPKYQTFKEAQRSFQDVAAYRTASFNLTGVEDPELLYGEYADHNYLSLLGLQPVQGRDFLAADNSTPGEGMVALISHGLWLRRFGGSDQAIGQLIHLNKIPLEIIGVMPEGFLGLTGRAQVWLPTMMLGAENLAEAWAHSLMLVARLKPETTIPQAQQEMVALGKVVDEAYAAPGEGQWGARGVPLNQLRTDPALRVALWVLFGAVVFVLLIGCVNLAHLTLVRAVSRRRDLAIRMAVGAPRSRVVGLLLIESLMLSIMGCLVGLVLAYSGVQLLKSVAWSIRLNSNSRSAGLTEIALGEIAMDQNVFLFCLAIAVSTTLLFGLLPALKATRMDPFDTLRSGREAGLASVRLGQRSLPIIAEVALAFILLVGSGLMIQSLGRLLDSDLGFVPENVLSVKVNLPSRDFTPASGWEFFSRLKERVEALPGVQIAGFNMCTPLSDACNGTSLRFLDRPDAGGQTEPIIEMHFADVSYFSALRIPLVGGRMFQAGDIRGAPLVVLLNKAAADRYWPDGDPVGDRVALGQGGFHDGAEVVGVVGNVRYGPIQDEATPAAYVPVAQSGRTRGYLFVRTAVPPESLIRPLGQQLKQLNKDLPLEDVQTMSQRVEGSASRARFSAFLLSGFAVLAVFLALTGVYGVLAYAVTRGRFEIGLRMALGAAPRDVALQVLRRALLLVVIGVAVGTVGALLLSGWLRLMLFEIEPSDPITLLATATLFLLAAGLAGYLPARRASQVDPLISLRAE